jgi:cytochrome c oxidase subunit II
MLDRLLPESASTFGADIDWLFMLILAITGVVFVLVQVTLIVFIIRYRRRDGRRAEYTHGNQRLEIIWTAATAVIVLTLAFLSRELWFDIKDPDRFPEAGLEIMVTGKQFEWNITYPGADGILGTADDVVSRNRMHVPVGVPIHLALESEDVIHSFFVAEFRVKQDLVPGMRIPAWFEATRTGEFAIGCAELCGLGHYRMSGTVIVQTADEFERWHQELARNAAPTVHTVMTLEPR